MPRTARVTTANACYHIITRGNQKQSVFQGKRDYEKYLAILLKYKNRFGFKLFAFCLMPNHVHLLMQVANPVSVPQIMHRINLSYTLYYNYTHDKVGHLWQDRFKSRIVETDAYLEECACYIENNPVRANLASHVTEHPWNSRVFRLAGNNLLDDFPG